MSYFPSDIPYMSEKELLENRIKIPKIEPTTESKTGRWILKSHMWECDKCGCRIRRANPFKGNIWNYNYCPNCGDKKEELS